ncbi:hypothetical protein F5Y03DRAFT_366540 [Xylaria venustula]|nr:hypothetical protein F5Y03DRAFT_366540 [Xylaria venustula]
MESPRTSGATDRSEACDDAMCLSCITMITLTFLAALCAPGFSAYIIYGKSEFTQITFWGRMSIAAALTGIYILILGPVIATIHYRLTERAVQEEREGQRGSREERLRRYLAMATGETPRRHHESNEQSPLLDQEAERGLGSGFDDRVLNHSV